jgi:signal transduction histidine kinase
MLRVLRSEPERITRTSIELREGNQTRYIQEVGSPVMNSQRQIVGRLLTLRDVTDEHLLAAYRDEISSMVVHDLRGPLGSIISSLNLIKEMAAEYGDDTMATVLDVSLESATNLLNLVDSLLEIARLETRRMPINQTPSDLHVIVDEAQRTLKTALTEADITLAVVIPEDLPHVNVDADKIRRVIINLLDNAVRYTPNGSRIRISAEHKQDKVHVSIADSGPGIDPSEAVRVFEKFRQISGSSPSRGSKGSGLGLTFCKLAVEAHDENIWVAPSGPLPGACFVFTLPISRSEEAEPSDTSQQVQV